MHTITGPKELLFRNTTEEKSTQYSIVTNKQKDFRYDLARKCSENNALFKSKVPIFWTAILFVSLNKWAAKL